MREHTSGDIGTPEADYEDGRKRHWNVASVNKRRDEWEAKRRLIAAAPDLLEALQEAADIVERYMQHTHELVVHMKITAALAKATGEQQ